MYLPSSRRAYQTLFSSPAIWKTIPIAEGSSAAGTSWRFRPSNGPPNSSISRMVSILCYTRGVRVEREICMKSASSPLHLLVERDRVHQFPPARHLPASFPHTKGSAAGGSDSLLGEQLRYLRARRDRQHHGASFPL